MLSVQVCQKGIVDWVLTLKCIRFLREFTHTGLDSKDEVIPSDVNRAGQSHVMLCPALFGPDLSFNNSANLKGDALVAFNTF